MREYFLIIAFQTIQQGVACGYKTYMNCKEIEVARKEFDEFPSEEDVLEFKKETHADRCEIRKSYE